MQICKEEISKATLNRDMSTYIPDVIRVMLQLDELIRVDDGHRDGREAGISLVALGEFTLSHKALLML